MPRGEPKFQFQVVLEVLQGDREAVEIARASSIHPTIVSCWKQEVKLWRKSCTSKVAKSASLFCFLLLCRQPTPERTRVRSSAGQ